MKVTKSAACLVLVSLASGALLPGCEGMSESEKQTWSTVGGAAAGALAGRAIAGKKNKTGGTIIGAVVGGLAGYALSGGFGSGATEEQKKDPAFQQANGEFDKGMEAKKAGNDQAALQHYTTASKMAPDQPEPYNNAGLIYLEQGDRANAEAMFRKAIAVDAEYEPAKINLEKMGLAG
jgi:tetratricopeptide (TPR) repeat protein